MLESMANYMVYDLMKFAEGDRVAETLNFFINDVVKIFVLVFLVVSAIAFVRTFVNPDKLRVLMSKARFGTGHLAAATFGAVTPFCSCSSIPLFIGFIKAEIPLGIAFSFLITSPLVNEVAFVMMGGLFGWKLAILYLVSGMAIGVVSGLLIGALKMEKEIILDKGDKEVTARFGMKFKSGLKFRLRYAVREGWKTFSKLWIYIIVGVALGAAIHGYVPQEFFMEYIGKFAWLSVPVAVLVGIPIYAGCATLVPVIFSIAQSGVPLGTSLAFMMAIAGLSAPEAIMLKRVMSFKLLATFFGIVAIGIVIIGYLFNAVG